MLTFLAPTALFGLSLLAIPIIVHLLKPRKMRHTSFSSLRWLYLTQQRLSRRIRWHQILLFLLRASFIVLLVLAIAKPMFHRAESGAGCDRIIVLDVSHSMSLRSGDRPTPLQTAKQLATTLVSQEQAGDRTALLATSSATTILSPLAHQGDNALPALNALQANLSDTDLGSALDVIRPMIRQRSAQGRLELYFITDNHQGVWRHNAIESLLEELPKDVKISILDVSDVAAQNGWIADCQVAESGSADRRKIDVQLRCIGGSQDRTVRLIGIAEMDGRTQAVSLEPGRPTQISFDLPVGLDVRGKTAELVLEPTDGLPADDRWFLTLDNHASLRVLIVEGGLRTGATLPPGFALRTAIESLSSPTQAIRVHSKKFNDLSPDDFREVDVVLWADVPEISETALRVLEEQVKKGVGLAVFLGPDVVAEFYNNKLFHSLDRSSGLMPVRLDKVFDVPFSQGGLAPLEEIAWNNPLLTGLFDPSLGDLGQIQVRSFYRLAVVPAITESVLASVSGVPSIIEHNVGAGKIILFNTTADDTWGDLSRRKSFVPLVDRLLNQLSGGAFRRTFDSGDTVTLATAPLQPEEKISISTPSGDTLIPSVSAAGNRTVLRLATVSEPGVYRVHRNSDAATEQFVVQVSRGDSLLTPFDAELLRAWWQPANFNILRADAATKLWAETARPVSLTVWLIALACAVLAAEMFLVHWLCPRINPPLTASIVQHRRPFVSHPAEKTT